MLKWNLKLLFLLTVVLGLANAATLNPDVSQHSIACLPREANIDQCALCENECPDCDFCAQAGCHAPPSGEAGPVPPPTPPPPTPPPPPPPPPSPPPPAPPPSVPPASPTSCPPVNPENIALDTQITSIGFITCNFVNKDACTYSSDPASPGVFVNGPADCPSAIIIKAPPQVAAALGAPAIDAAVAGSAPAAGGTSTKGDMVISKPILVALLAMNAALVLALLTMTVVWAFVRRTSASGGGSGYKSVPSK
ncbi:hypothetical protein C8F04DRAFT_1235912 [Mycena alexandri]|uniref:Uncharacterized protein n=1 Tax=Mycena alexandri TaxID=1745969 RepID=A0AAD6WY47_9AGAR|nr:hypothetical protein C8F04DRAFT_1235912 [Mycena alexandri]